MLSSHIFVSLPINSRNKILYGYPVSPSRLHAQPIAIPWVAESFLRSW